MRDRVPGVWIPDEVIQRMAKTPKAQQAEEGKRICVEIIQQVREIEGVAGVHVMAYRQEEAVAEVIQRAGLLPRQPRLPRFAIPSDEGQGLQRSPQDARQEVAQLSALASEPASANASVQNGRL